MWCSDFQTWQVLEREQERPRINGIVDQHPKGQDQLGWLWTEPIGREGDTLVSTLHDWNVYTYTTADGRIGIARKWEQLRCQSNGQTRLTRYVRKCSCRGSLLTLSILHGIETISSCDDGLLQKYRRYGIHCHIKPEVDQCIDAQNQCHWGCCNDKWCSSYFQLRICQALDTFIEGRFLYRLCECGFESDSVSRKERCNSASEVVCGRGIIYCSLLSVPGSFL